MDLTSRIFIAEKITNDVFAGGLLLNVGKKMDNVESERLKKKLKEIVEATGSFTKAKARYYTPNELVLPKEDGNNQKVKSENFNREVWDKDKKALDIAFYFFSQRQNFLSLKLPTIQTRLRTGPWSLYYEGDSYSKKFLNSINSVAKAFISGLEKWEKADKDSGGIKQEFPFEGYKIVNKAGLGEAELAPFLEVIKKGDSYIPSKLKYGNVNITTSKEMRRADGVKTLAYYTPHNDEIAIIIDVNDSQPVHSFVHEMGHRLWYKFLSPDVKNAVLNFFKGTVMSRSVEADNLKDLYRDWEKTKTLDFKYNLEKLKDSPEIKKVLLDSFEKMNKNLHDATYDFMKLEPEINVSEFQNEVRFKDGDIELDYEKVRSAMTSLVLLRRVTLNGLEMAAFFNTRKKAANKLADKTYKEFAREINGLLMQVVNVIADMETKDGNIFPSAYSKTDREEFFAENYSYYKIGNKPISKTMQEILKNY